MAEPLPPLLRLPRELRIQILSYLLRQGESIRISEGGITPKRRKLNRELQRLKDPNWKAPKKHFPDVLRVCKELRLSGLMTFWSGNAFVFGDCNSVQTFVSKISSDVVSNITSVTLGEDYHYEGDKLDMFNERLKRHSIRGNWPHPAWPPSMDILSQLPKLRSLELVVGSLVEGVGTDARGLLSSQPDKLRPRWFEELEAHQRSRWPPRQPLLAPASIYYRDQMLLGIPEAVFDNLRGLRIRYHVPGLLPWTTREVLPFAKDLRERVWRECPDFKPGRADDEQVRCWERWVEARAAVHWDDSLHREMTQPYVGGVYEGYSKQLLVKQARKEVQWCTWAWEWQQIDEDGKTLWAPRSYEELVGPPDEVEGDSEDASWAWQKKRKAAEMSE